MVKTATSAGNLWVWVGRPEGPDPRAHGWLEAEEGHWVRLCDGSSWAWACDPGNDFRMNFPVFCWLCDDIAFDDYLSGRKRLRVLSPGWRERYKPSRHNKGMDVQPVEGSMLPVPMSAVVAFGVARTEKKREEIVCRAKYGPSGAGEEWGNPNAGFLKCLRESDHPSMVEDVQKNCLHEWVNRGNCKERVQRELLHDALMSQWVRHKYKFYKVDEYPVTVAGLTIMAKPDIGMQTRSGRRPTVKLWLQARPISKMQHKLVIGLLGAHRKQGVLFTDEASPVGVWGMRQGDFEPVDTVSADVRATTQSVVEQFCRVHDRV